MEKGCIFDLDGTLLDSMHVWDDFAYRYLQRNGISTTEALDQVFASCRMEEAIHYLHVHYVKKSEEEIAKEIYELLCERYRDMPLKSGVKECILHLREKGISMGVLSANHVSVCEAALDKHGIKDCFQDIISCEQLHLSKSDPQCFLQACEQMGWKIQDTIVIEDALHAIQGAKKAGAFVVAVKENSQRKDEEEIRRIADVWIEDMTELEEIM